MALSPVIQQLNRTGDIIRAAGTRFGESINRQEQLNLEKARLDFALNDPNVQLQRQQSQAQLDQINASMNTPYSAIDLLKDASPEEALSMIESDVNHKIIDALNSIKAFEGDAHFIDNPTDPDYGKIRVTKPDGTSRYVSQYEMMTKYAPITEGIARTAYDPMRTIEDQIITTEAEIESISSQKDLDAPQQNKLQQLKTKQANLSRLYNDSDFQLRVTNKKLDYLDEFNARMKSINPNYSGLDRNIARTEAIKNQLIKQKYPTLGEQAAYMTAVGKAAPEKLSLKQKLDLNKENKSNAIKMAKDLNLIGEEYTSFIDQQEFENNYTTDGVPIRDAVYQRGNAVLEALSKQYGEEIPDEAIDMLQKDLSKINKFGAAQFISSLAMVEPPEQEPTGAGTRVLEAGKEVGRDIDRFLGYRGRGSIIGSLPTTEETARQSEELREEQSSRATELLRTGAKPATLSQKDLNTLGLSYKEYRDMSGEEFREYLRSLIEE